MARRGLESVGDGVKVVLEGRVELHGREAGAVVLLLMVGPGTAAPHAGQIQAALRSAVHLHTSR